VPVYSIYQNAATYCVFALVLTNPKQKDQRLLGLGIKPG